MLLQFRMLPHRLLPTRYQFALKRNESRPSQIETVVTMSMVVTEGVCDACIDITFLVRA